NTSIVGSNWNPTLSGQKLIDLLNSWTTPTQNLTVGSDGTINFNGFWGDYNLTIDGHTYPVSLTKGTSLYSVIVAPGDFNGDHVVDANDYVLWRKSVGSTTDFRADGNGDRIIDDSDYAVWQSHFGAVYASAAGLSAAVPEPCGITMILIGVLVTLSTRRRR